MIHVQPFARLMAHFGVITVMIAACVPQALHANSEIREWKFEEGDSITAEIATIDEAKNTLVLRDANGHETTVAIETLSMID